MYQIIETPPQTVIEPVTDLLHGLPVTDPYRWLEDQASPRTRQWIDEQTRYARLYLNSLPGRDRVKQRIQEYLSVETYDSLQLVGNRYFFRKRLATQEQPCICMREGCEGEDQVLVDPAERGTGKYTAVNILCVSRDGKMLAYEVKQGGEQSGTFEIIDVESRRKLPDSLPRGFLHGFTFASDSKSYLYVHEPLASQRPHYRAAYQHFLDTVPGDDIEVFFAGEDPNITLSICSDEKYLGLLVYRFGRRMETDFYLQSLDSPRHLTRVIERAPYIFRPILIFGRIFVTTDKDAPNMRIVEVVCDSTAEMRWLDIVPETDARIARVAIASGKLFVSYVKETFTRIAIHSLSGQTLGEIPVSQDETARLMNNRVPSDEIVYETESFTRPVTIFRYLPNTKERKAWVVRRLPFDGSQYDFYRVRYTSKDGIRIPMFIVGRRDVLDDKAVEHPTILTAYGGFGACMTPQFSIFVAFMIEHGCLFALPNIRGGSEFGAAWHEAGKRRNRQNAYDDFLSAAEWLINSGRTARDKLAIFGGSNSGLLVAAALTQRSDLFRAALSIAPLLDMLRYHLFDFGNRYVDEYGTAEDVEDFVALYGYSPYHRIQDGIRYPAVMFVSGDADGNCNPLHARKMTARLQAANSSENPILLDYREFRGHSPVLPLSERIDGLTDRLNFLCERLGIVV